MPLGLTTEVLELADLEGGTYYQCLGVGGQAYQGIRTSRQSQKAYPGLRPVPWRSPADLSSGPEEYYKKNEMRKFKSSNTS